MQHPSSDAPQPAAAADSTALRRQRNRWVYAVIAGFALIGVGASWAARQSALPWLAQLYENATGVNPHPIHLMRPKQAQLSALARLGQQIFNDKRLSASGKQSCASCHSPDHGYGPPNALAVQYGGPNMDTLGFRAAPSLAYLYRQASFSIGPDQGDQDAPVDLNQVASQALDVGHIDKAAGATAQTVPMVPQGGLFWDGRADTLQGQALGPLLNPAEMANHNQAEVAKKLASAPYSDQFKPLFGPNILNQPDLLVAEAMSALGRYQIEDSSFHRFDSKYDLWLEGRARLSFAELRGLRIFNDAKGANCAACHPSQPGADGLPPLFTDTQFEALGVPRNTTLKSNQASAFFDLGLCGPVRDDLSTQTQYCGMFLTPTLRNSASRPVYFHNGVYTSLRQVLDFYNLRDTHPDQIYPRTAAGAVDRYNDLPSALRGNVDTLDAPFNRHLGQVNAMSEKDLNDLEAFLRTLDDGYDKNAS